jgi:hypothetical protein
MLFLLSGAAASGKKTVARELITRVANLAARHENEIPSSGQSPWIRSPRESKG